MQQAKVLFPSQAGTRQLSIAEREIRRTTLRLEGACRNIGTGSSDPVGTF